MRKLILLLALTSASALAAKLPAYDVQARDSYVQTEQGNARVCTVRIEEKATGKTMLYSVPADCEEYIKGMKAHESDVFGGPAAVYYHLNGTALNVI